MDLVTAASTDRPRVTGGVAMRGVLLWGLVLQALWLAFWPLARFLDLHPSFTDEYVERLPGNRSLLHLLTGWAEPILAGWDMPGVAVLLVAWYITSFVVYLTAVRALRGADRRTSGAVLLLAIVFQITFFLLPILFTTDGFSYASYGEIQWTGQNPYTTVPLNLFSSRITWLVPSLWREVPSIYGPLWNLVSIPIAQAVGSDPVAAILAYKAAVNVSHLASVLLIWFALGRIAPDWQAGGTALYAWNPMVLIEFCANGHNDVTMLAFLIAACALALLGRLPVALVALAASTAIKFTSVVTLPFWLFYWARTATSLKQAAARLVGGGLLVVALVVLCYVPYWRGINTFGPVIHWLGAPMFANTVLEFLLGWFVQTLGGALFWAESPSDLAGAAFRWIVRLGFASYLLWEAWRLRTVSDLIAASARVLTVFLLAVNSWVMPWYFLWAVGLTPFLPWHSWTVRWVLLTAAFGSAVIYFFHFGDRTTPVEAIHLLLLPSAAIGAMRLAQWIASSLTEPADRSIGRSGSEARSASSVVGAAELQ